MTDGLRRLLSRIGPAPGAGLVALALVLTPVAHLAHAAVPGGALASAPTGAAPVPAGRCGGAGCEMASRCRAAKARLLGLAAYQPRNPDQPGFCVLPARTPAVETSLPSLSASRDGTRRRFAGDLFLRTERLRL